MQDYPITIDFSAIHGMNDQEFLAFCEGNRNLQIERNADGTITIMAPAGFHSSDLNSEITTELKIWLRSFGQGTTTDSSGGYKLPDSSVFAPDAAWISSERLQSISKQDLQRFLPACPNFVVELVSPADHLPSLRRKMLLWLANGVELAWMINPIDESVEIYEQGKEPVTIHGFDNTLSGKHYLPGFTLNLSILRR